MEDWLSTAKGFLEPPTYFQGFRMSRHPYTSSSDVQFGQRLALMSIDEKQKGHSFVDTFFSSFFFNLFTAFMTKKSTRAIMMKLIIAFTKTP